MRFTLSLTTCRSRSRPKGYEWAVIFLALILFPRNASSFCFDYSSGSTSSILGSYNLPSGDRAFGVAVSGNYAYISSDDGLRILNVSNPASPTMVGFLGYPDFINGHSIVVSEPYLYAAAWNYFIIVDISSKTAPHLVGKASMPGAATCLAISGTHAYVGGGQYLGVQVVDISNPNAPVIVGNVHIMQYSNGIAISDHYAYVAGYEQGANYRLSGLHAVDIANPTSPVVVGHVDSPGLAQDVVLQGTYAYLADSYAGFHVVDIAVPTSPAIIGSVDTPGRVHQIAFDAPYAYVTDRTYGLQVIDVTTPTLPSILGGRSGLAYAYGIAVNAKYVYFLLGGADAPQSALDILPIQCRPCTSPLPLAAIEVDPNVINTQGEGNYVTGHLEFPPEYDPAQVMLDSVRLNETVSASPDYFEIMDWNHNGVSDLAVRFARDAVEATLAEGDSVPILISGIIEDRCFSGTDLVRVIRPHLNRPNGGETYLAGERTVVEWGNPQGQTVDYAQIHYSPDGGNSWTLVADRVTGTSYEWTVPTEPTANGELRIDLVDGAGVMGYDASDTPFALQTSTGISDAIPAVHRLYQNSPNPFRSATRIAFDLPEATLVTLEVFDLTGREVRVLANSWYPAGNHELTWDARDPAGHPVAGGIYFMRLEAGSFSDAKRMYIER